MEVLETLFYGYFGSCLNCTLLLTKLCVDNRVEPLTIDSLRRFDAKYFTGMRRSGIIYSHSYLPRELSD